MRLTLAIEDGKITAARFRAKGCAASIACGSLLTEMITNQALDDVKKLGREELTSALGGLNPESNHAAALAIDTLRAALTRMNS